MDEAILDDERSRTRVDLVSSARGCLSFQDHWQGLAGVGSKNHFVDKSEIWQLAWAESTPGPSDVSFSEPIVSVSRLVLYHG